jgi:hypothetical protein
MEREILELVKTRGPVTPRWIARTIGVKKSYVNAVLHHSKDTSKTLRRPMGQGDTRPIWTYTPGCAVRPVKVSRIKKKKVDEESTSE